MDTRERPWTGHGGEDGFVYAYGLIYASVCTDISDEAATERLNRELPTGVESRWRIAEEPFRDGSPNPHPCERGGDRRHILFTC